MGEWGTTVVGETWKDGRKEGNTFEYERLRESDRKKEKKGRKRGRTMNKCGGRERERERERGRVIYVKQAWGLGMKTDGKE